MGLTQILKNSEYFWAFRDLSILTERPVRISLDEDDLIHSDDQMAIEYSDGWGIRVNHGSLLTKKTVSTDASKPDTDEEIALVVEQDSTSSSSFINDSLSSTPSPNISDAGYSADVFGLQQHLSNAGHKFFDHLDEMGRDFKSMGGWRSLFDWLGFFFAYVVLPLTYTTFAIFFLFALGKLVWLLLF